MVLYMPEHTKVITAYSFGKIEINNRPYSDDVIIFEGEVHSGWRRKKGHRVEIDDLKRAPLEKVKHLIIGTGSYGMMTVSSSLEEYCIAHGIHLESMRTLEAVERFNACREKANLLGAFHLHC